MDISNPFNMKNDSNKTDEFQIAALLKLFQPRPSSSFYKRMGVAPWVKPKGRVWDKLPTNGTLSHLFQMRAMTIAVIVVLLIAIGIIASPSLRVIAQQIAQYFLPADSNQISVPISISPPAKPLIPGSPDAFTLSLSEVQDVSGFTPKEIPLSLYGLSFNGAYYDPNLQLVTLRYTGEGFMLLITQRRLGEIEEYSSIGANAPVESVSVRGVMGEFVSGGWRIISEGKESLSTTTPGTTLDLDVVWDSELPLRTLRWQEDNILYEILLTGSNGFGKSDMLYIAERVK